MAPMLRRLFVSIKGAFTFEAIVQHIVSWVIAGAIPTLITLLLGLPVISSLILLSTIALLIGTVIFDRKRKKELATSPRTPLAAKKVSHQDVTVHAETVTTSRDKARPNQVTLRSALQAELTKGRELWDRAISLTTTTNASILAMRGLTPATQEELREWEKRVRALLRSTPQYLAHFDAGEAHPLSNITMAMEPQLRRDLKYRLDRLEEVIKELD